jgi:predicted DNA-binding protein
MKTGIPATVAKVAISLPPDLLGRVDDEAKAKGQSRSAYIRETLERALAVVEEERAVREARAVYAAIEEDPAFWPAHEAFARIASETVPPFEAHDEAPTRRSASNAATKRPVKNRSAAARR